MDAEVELSGGWQTSVHRRGTIVLRSPKPQSSSVIALLRHLEAVGFDAAPRVVGNGFADDGREQLTFIEGESPQPVAWSDDAAHAVGQLLRQLHDATATFIPPGDATWQPWFARSMGGSERVIGHGDLGPWNILARSGTPVAFIDWDQAGPVDPIVELAEAAWLNAQLHDIDVAELNDLGSPLDRAQQLRLIVDGYGLDRRHRSGFVDTMIEFAIRSARQEAVDHAVGPDTASPRADGFPLLWAVTWRTRAAAWMLDHRTMLRAALS